MNQANIKSRSRVQGEAIVVFIKNTKVVETKQMKDFRVIETAKAGYAKHGPVTMLVKQKGESWGYFDWKSKEKGTTHRRASLKAMWNDKVSPEVKMIAMLAEME